MVRTLLLSLLLLSTVSCQLLPVAESLSPVETVEVTTPLSSGQESGDGVTASKGQKPLPAGTPESPTGPATEPAATGGAAAWTILVYMNTGADLEEVAKRDLEEMAAAGPSPAVNLLVQVGSGLGEEGTIRRYRLGDAGGATVTAPPLVDLGAADMADPAVLAEFIAWGMADYPATHYALLLWDYFGGGWQGIARDERGDARLLPRALVEALATVEPLDLVAFDAGRMSQLEVYQALYPHAHYAVASAAPWPAAGRDYEQLLVTLNANPGVAPPALARLLVDTLVHPYVEDDPDARVTMTAVDLAALPGVTAALEALGTALAEEAALVAPAVADARAGAETYLALSPADELLATSVDLGHFARRLYARTPDPAIAGQARALYEALAEAVISQEQGSAFPDGVQGVTFYFPRSASTYGPEYADLADTATWDEFLTRFYTVGQEAVIPPDLNVVHLAGEVASIQQPAYLDFELVGRDVEAVAVAAGRQEADGRLRLLGYYPQRPAQDFDLSRWQDGVHEGYFVWETDAGYLSDGTDGEFVLFWPTGPDGERYVLPGRLRPAATGRQQEATLVFDGRTGELQSVWAYRGESRGAAPRQLSLQSGDLFQPYHLFLADAGVGPLSYEPGVTLTIPEEGTLRYTDRPLPEGEYVLGMIAETMDGERTTAFTTLDVSNPEEDPPAHAYLDPFRAFQFLYPVSWPAPTYADDRLVVVAPEADTRLTITIYPDGDPDGTASLKGQTLQQFGAVSLLYEEEIFVGETAGLLVAYGYEAPGGSRTGLFFTFVHQGVGYVVDVDGPAAAEAETISVVDQLVDSWLFRPLGVGAFPGRWTTSGEGVVGAVPTSYIYEELDNGWQRFSGDEGFIAFRQEPTSAASREEIVKRWLDIAGGEVASFTPEPAYSLSLAGNHWVRARFTYNGAAGSMQGFVMATIHGGQELVAWAEAPAAVFPQLEQAVFLMVAAERLAAQPGEAGLLYEAPFIRAGSWGIGTLPGAEGEVADGVYRLLVEAEEGFFWSTAGQNFTSGTYEVTATQTAGPLDNGYGLLLRADNETGAFYVFEISGDGYAWIGRCDDGCTEAVTLVGSGWFPAPAVQTGLNAPNRLRVGADGAHLTFFVNDNQVAQLSDAVLASGDIGFFVETLGEGGVTVDFSDLRAYAR